MKRPVGKDLVASYPDIPQETRSPFASLNQVLFVPYGYLTARSGLRIISKGANVRK